MLKKCLLFRNPTKVLVPLVLTLFQLQFVFAGCPNKALLDNNKVVFTPNKKIVNLKTGQIITINSTRTGNKDGKISTDSDRGIGTEFDWVPWPEAIFAAQKLNKPILLLIHKSWCPVSAALRGLLNGTAALSEREKEMRKEVVELARRFVMVNTEEEAGYGLENEAVFGVYGRYVPRFHVLDTYGQPLPIEKTNANYPNFFEKLPEVLDMMKQGLKFFKEGVPEEVATLTIREPMSDLARGLGGTIHWIPWSGALVKAKELGKPIFLLIHQSGCAASRAMKEGIKSSPKRPKLVELSRQFVMVSLESNPSEKWLAPDGQYIPRLLFILARGKQSKVLPVQNKNHPNYKAYFPTLDEIIAAMEEALQQYKELQGWQEVGAQKLEAPPTEPTQASAVNMPVDRKMEDQSSHSSDDQNSRNSSSSTADRNATGISSTNDIDNNEIVLIEEAEHEALAVDPMELLNAQENAAKRVYTRPTSKEEL